MSKVVRIITGVALAVVGAVTGNWQLIIAGVSMIGDRARLGAAGPP